MITFTAEVVGENSVATRLTSVQAFLRRRLVEGMKESLDYYVNEVSGNELSGGVLQSRSGKLRSSFYKRVDDKVTRIVGVTYPKARSKSGEKYGFMLAAGTKKDIVDVLRGPKAQRKLVRRLMKRHSLSTLPEQYSAGSFKRRMIKAKIPKPFMGPAYERTRETIARKMRAAVGQAMADANGST